MLGIRSFVDDVREYFWLRDADARAEKIPEGVRSSFQTDVQLAQQKRAAAEILWSSGPRAEAFASAFVALELALRAAQSAETALPEKLLGDAKSLVTEIERRPRPLLEDGMTPDHTEQFERMLALHRSLDDRLMPAALDARHRRELRISRAASVVALLVALVGAVWFLRRPGPPRTDASASWSAKFVPSNTTDGIDTTEWLLPDATAGWLDVFPPKPRSFQAVKILNSYNKSDPLRMSQEIAIEVWSGGRLLKTIPATMATGSKPDWRTFDFQTGSEKIDRVRVLVKSWAGSGGGIAEIQLVP